MVDISTIYTSTILTMLKIIPLYTFGLLLAINISAQHIDMKQVEKNGMEVSWHFSDQLIHFEVEAPTQGWVTIGFNTHTGIQGAYLLMGRIKHAKAEVVEHYTVSPGKYKPITQLGGEVNIKQISGEESNGRTLIRFSVPVEASNAYQKSLKEGLSYTLILAYSAEDDFQHHSRMRTSHPITL